MRLGVGRFLALVAVFLAPLADPGSAQLSPGPLSTAHAALEGNRTCLSCHRAGQGVDAALCFDCHRALAQRVAAGKGLHVEEGFQRCERCHSEHNGLDFGLIEWPGGEAAFDHARIGWKLEGRHATSACRDCHREERVEPALRALEPGLIAGKTRLGLKTTCAACHTDPHRGSMRSTICSDCHSQTHWRDPRPFDHATTRFALDGRHVTAACTSCHKPEAGRPEAEADAPQGTAAKQVVFDQFRSRATPPSCADCHRDPHAGRLGGDCARCHSTTNFRVALERITATTGFDHNRTAYPLSGKHRVVECARCHKPGRELRIAGFERCESCHADRHLGQLAQIGRDLRGGSCTACHTVDSFRPARFGAEEHERSRFALAGAHRAVPCSGCHLEVEAAALEPAFRRAGEQRAVRFRLAGIACLDCHRDPHGGELVRFDADQGCVACHDQSKWRPARFDHEKSRFPLAGAHRRVTCVRCHAPATAAASAQPRASGEGERRFSGRPLDCVGCHRDVHAGQFAIAGGTDCARCHGLERFRPTVGFDHATTRFALDGLHVQVDCARCHPGESQPEGSVVRYRPRPTDCSGCHGAPLRGDA